MLCHWCREDMDESAIVCSFCRRERKDFHQHKVLTYLFACIWVLSVVYGIGADKWFSEVSGLFEVSRLFTTLAGWSAIISLIVFVFTYNRASKVAGRLWWHW